jgi:dTDP-4-amino-4,6-dideoxygalactose transaminase
LSTKKENYLQKFIFFYTNKLFFSRDIDKMSERQLENLIQKYRLEQPVYVTRPQMPSLDDYVKKLEVIWQTHWLTNDGPFHTEFVQKLANYLDVKHLNLFVNATIALIVALKSLDISEGEVITTPFTFPASVHVLWWNRLTPVFCDIEEKTFNLDSSKIETLITPQTKAILPVHVYGSPCDVIAIQKIADKYGLKVIYDAAHAFGVKLNGKSVLDYGDMSALSFHATKLFNTIEGGALICRNNEIKEKIRFLKNFGIAGEEAVIGPGINGKMNEFQAAFGLLGLEHVDQEIRQRKGLTELYRCGLKDVPGIRCPEDLPGVTHNYGYFPILVDLARYGCDRNELHQILKKCNIYTRKYFYPLCSDYACYSGLPSARPELLPVARRVSSQVLCLPLYGEFGKDVVEVICKVVRDRCKIKL